jgi:3-hydroxy acid dehydrogenase / malonic semialdehyde reductase
MNASRTNCFSIELARIRISNALTSTQHCFKLRSAGVRVTNVEPGMCETDFSLVRFKGDAERAEKVYANTPPLTADDVAEAVFWAATLPPHFNVNRVEIMPTTQAFGPLAIHRNQ